MPRRISLAVWLLIATATTVGAQGLNEQQKSALLAQRWSAALLQAAAREGATLLDNQGRPVTAIANARRVGGNDELRRSVYERAVSVLAADPLMHPFFERDPSLVQQVSLPSDQEWVAKLRASDLGQKPAKSTNASLTNPVAPKTAERSGFTELVALALDARNAFAANDSAITVSLNALALIGLKSETRSAPALYRQYDALRRLGGSFTFGAKIPEGEITGLTGFPSADTLLDAATWDVKVRVYGDRDPRAERWYDIMQGYLGGLNEIAATLISSPLVPADDRTILQAVLQDSLVGPALARVKHDIDQSAQITVKTGGLHLTNEPGKNKYTFALLGDKGFGDTDLTGNIAYAIVDDVSLGPQNVVQLKTWTGAVAVNHLVAKNALVQGRATELSFNVNFEVPIDNVIERKTVWNLVGAVSVPWGDSATIPVSITFASDPNKLKKEKFVRGQIGISYDFGALRSLFKPIAVKE